MGLVRLGVFEHHGNGPGAFYAIARNRAIKVPNVPCSVPDKPAEKRATYVPIVPSEGPED